MHQRIQITAACSPKDMKFPMNPRYGRQKSFSRGKTTQCQAQKFEKFSKFEKPAANCKRWARLPSKARNQDCLLEDQRLLSPGLGAVPSTGSLRRSLGGSEHFIGISTPGILGSPCRRVFLLAVPLLLIPVLGLSFKLWLWTSPHWVGAWQG